MLMNFVFSSLTDVEMQQEPLSPTRKRKNNDEKSSSEENKRPKSSVTYLSPKLPPKNPDYQIGPSSWIRKEIHTYALERLLVSSIFALLQCLLSFLLFNSIYHIASYVI